MDEIIDTLKQILQDHSNEMDYDTLFNTLEQEYPCITKDEYDEILAQHTDIFKWQQLKKDNNTIENIVSLQPITPPTIPNQQSKPNIEHLPRKVVPMPPNQNNKK